MRHLTTSFRDTLLALLVCMASGLTAMAFDFEVEGIYYNQIGDGNVSVTYGASSYNTYKGQITIPDQVTYDGINYTVTEIAPWAFMYCVRLTDVTLPSTLVKIGDNAFNSCTMLTAITIPDGLQAIEDCAFYYCSRLETVTIPNSVTSIGEEAFYDCDQLHSVVIGRSVQTIGSKAFGAYSYSSLVNVTCLAAVPPVMENADVFHAYSYNNATLCVPLGNLEAYKSTLWWCDFLNVTGIATGGILGDVNDDGFVNISDVIALISFVLNEGGDLNEDNADYNQDGVINISDIIKLISYILEG